MKKIFDEYSVLLLSFICSIVGFEVLFKVLVNSDSIHNIVDYFLYGTL